MAFSQTPNLQTTQEKRIPITVGQTIASNVLDATSYQGQRFINCYPKREKLANTDDKWILTKVPATTSTTVTYTGSGTDIISVASDDGRYVWKNGEIYDSISGALVTAFGVPANRAISFFRAVDPTGASANYYVGLIYNTGTGQTFSWSWPGSGAITLSAALPFALNLPQITKFTGNSAYLNGRLFALASNGRIYNTPAGAYTTWNTTNFIVPEIKGDRCLCIAKYKNHLVAFSEQSTEFFYDGAIDIGSPLVRQESYAQLQGVRSFSDVVQLGDMFFILSWTETGSYAFYTLDSFAYKRISTLYIETLMNNDDYTGGTPGTADVYMALMFGDVVGCVTPPSGGTNHLAFNFTTGVWFEWTAPISGLPVGMPPTNLSSSFSPNQYNTYFITATGTDTVTFAVLTKDYNSATPVTAEYVEDISDFGSQRWKTFYQVYFVGDAGNNTVEFAWTPAMDYSGWTAYQTMVKDPEEYIKIDNIGAYRRLARKWRFTGTSNIMMEGSEVRYNLGSQ